MKYRRRDGGQAVVEFAAMFPFLLFMALFIVEFGFGAYQWVTVRNAASEAARYAAVGNLPFDDCRPGSIQARAVSTSNNLVDCGEISVSYYGRVAGEVTRGSGVTVEIDYEHATITPLPALVSMISWGMIPNTWTLNACSDSRVETRPSPQDNFPSDGPPCG